MKRFLASRRSASVVSEGSLSYLAASRTFKTSSANPVPYYSPEEKVFNKLPPELANHKPRSKELGTLPHELEHPELSHSVVKISHVKGDNHPPLLHTTIGEFFEKKVSLYGDKEVLRVVHQDVRWSWVELKRHVDAFAAGLIKLGYEKGDRLGVWMPNNSEWVVAKLAAARLGVILVNVNPAYRVHELEHALRLVGCKGILLSPKFKTSDYIHMMEMLFPELANTEPGKLASSKVPSLKHIIHTSDEHFKGMYRYNDVLQSGETVTALFPELDRMLKNCHYNDPINIQFTSGTTGLPKGATLTHNNILNNGQFVGERMKLTTEDVMCVPVPLYHCFGLVLGNLAALTHGSKIVYPSAGFDALAVLQTVEKEKCTVLHGVPTMFIAELEHPEFKKFDLSSLRTGIMAGSPCPIEIMKRVISQMHMRDVTICYGMTETSPVSFQTEIDSPLEKRVETIGRIHPHLECKVVNSDGWTVPIDTIGELCTKGYSVMKGYWNDEKKTKEAIDGAGWMHTGDLAVIDDEGYCRIVGRIKDMIIRGGENVYPREIEEFLHAHPGIEDIAVFGVPDKTFGEQICAWVKRKKNEAGQSLTPESIRAYCKDQIAHYKVPHYILFKEEFPLTISGKILKYVMRDQTVHELGLQNQERK